MKPAVVIIDPISSGRRYGVEAQALGYRTIAVLTRRSLPETLSKFAGLKGFDEVHYMTSMELTLAYLENKNVKAVIAGHHFALNVIDEMASALGHIGNAPDLRLERINKIDMKRRLRDCGVPATMSYPISKDTLGDLPNTGLEFPVVLKPAEGSGSLRVKVCHDIDGLSRGLDLIDILDKSYVGRNGFSLVEEYIPGDEFFVTTANLGNGKRKMLCFAKYDKVQIGDDPSIYRNIFSQPIDSPEALRAFEYVSAVNDALGVEYGINDVELKFVDNECRIIEQNNRLPGANVPHLIEKCTSINCYQLNIEVFSGVNPQASEHVNYKRHFCVCCLVNPEEGDVDTVENVELLNDIPAVVGVDLLVGPGEFAPRTVDFITAFAFVYLVDDDPEKLKAYANEIHEKVKLRMKEKPAPAEIVV